MPLPLKGRCLVLGGRGFIGSHLVDHLLSEGVPVRIFTRRTPADATDSFDRGPHPLLDVVSGDFTNDVDVSHALQDCETCVHLIWSTLPKTSNENMTYDVQTNICGSIRLLQLAKRHGLRKAVFISSGGTVYGEPLYSPIDEAHPTNPTTSYGVTKLAAEKYFLMFRANGLDTAVIRLSNPFGERQRANSSQGAIGVFTGLALRGKPIRIWGDGSVTRDYLYVRDAVRAIALALAYHGDEAVFNVASGVGLSLIDLVEKISAAIGREVEVIFEPSRSFDVSRNVLSIGRVRSVLGWTPRATFDDALDQTVSWLSSRLGSPAGTDTQSMS